MEQILQNIKEILGVPAFLINQCPILPQYIKLALIDSINFIPWLYILYYGIELLERFFLTHIEIFVKLIQKLGPLFGVAIANVPECGYQVIASTFYSRRMMTRGTLLAFLIAGSDDALPLLFMDLSKAFVIRGRFFFSSSVKNRFGPRIPPGPPGGIRVPPFPVLLPDSQLTSGKSDSIPVSPAVSGTAKEHFDMANGFDCAAESAGAPVLSAKYGKSGHLFHRAS